MRAFKENTKVEKRSKILRQYQKQRKTELSEKTVLQE